MEKNPENIQKYLEEVSKLESSVYEQKQCCEYADRTIKLELPPKRHSEKPVRKYPEIPKEPSLEKVEIGSLIFRLICFLIGGTLTFLGFWFNGIILLIIPGILITLFFTLLLIQSFIAIPKDKKIYKKRLAEYQRAIDEQFELDKKYKEEYEIALAEYEERHAREAQKYAAKCKQKQEIYYSAKCTVRMMTQTYEETKKVLDQIYAYDVLFPKYRNMAAVFTMLEYFQTGRCTELTGPDGAYNLYEAELRQNLILNKLDTIIDKLDQIKDNQFLLYSEMTKVNKNLSVIAQETQELLDVTKQVEANTLLTARFSAITAQNTAVIATLTALS